MNLLKTQKLEIASTSFINSIAMSDLCPVPVSQDSVDLEDQPETASESQLLFLKQRKYCDVTFTFPNLPDKIEAHEFCLKARSPVFEQIFRMRKSGNVQGNEIEISESTPERFQEFLEFIYTDKLEVDIAGALDLLNLAHKYKIRPLIKKCEELLKTDIPIEASVKVFETARHYGRQELMDRAGGIMVKSFLDLVQMGSLTNATEETLIFVLERDDLQVDEIKLFELVLEWGRIQVGPSADEQLLKNKLKNIILKIRFTNMAPYEFTKTVMPTRLLSAEESLSIFSYFAGDDLMRRDMEINFNTNPRKVGKMENFVDFYTDEKYEYVSAPAFSKQRISFKAERMDVITKGWSENLLRKTLITAIQIWWPLHSAGRCRELGFSHKFSVSIRQYSGPVDDNDESCTIRFQTTILNSECKIVHIEYITVEPPVELVSGTTYSVIVEDQSTSGLNLSLPNSHFVYAGLGYLGTSPQASARMGGTRLLLNEIQMNNEPNELECSERSPKFAVVQGIHIRLL